MHIRELIAATTITILFAATFPVQAHTHRGTPVQSGYVDREVTLPEGAKYLNVQRNETVKINVAGKSFTWRFDTLGTVPFKLGEIVPQGYGGQDIMVYVAEDPNLVSGGN